MPLFVDKYQTELNRLPDEVLREIFHYLRPADLLVCEHVCQRWRALVQDRAMWKNHLIVHSENPKHNERNLSLIYTHGKYLSLLQLKYIEEYSVIESILEKCNRVTSLELVRCVLDREFESDLNNCLYLRKLNLRTSVFIETCDISLPFDNLTYLQYLSLSNFGLNSSNCDTLLVCNNLTHIYIENIKKLDLEFVKKLISSKQSVLVALHIDGGGSVDDSCLNMLSKCSQLKDLAIRHSDSLTDKGLTSLTDFKNVEILKICNNSGFSEKYLVHIFNSNSGLVTLKALDLSGVRNVSLNVVDVAVQYCRNMKCITLYKCPKLEGCDRQLKVKLRNITIALY